MNPLWTKLDKSDDSTWPAHDQVVFIANAGKKEGTFNLGVGQALHTRDSVSFVKFWKWEAVIFFRGARFTAEYWRPLITKDFPDCDL